MSLASSGFAMVTVNTTPARWWRLGPRKKCVTWLACTKLAFPVQSRLSFAVMFLWWILSAQMGGLHPCLKMSHCQNPNPENYIFSAFRSLEIYSGNVDLSMLISVNSTCSTNRTSCMWLMSRSLSNMIIHMPWSSWEKTVQMSQISSRRMVYVSWLWESSLTLSQILTSPMTMWMIILKKHRPSLLIEE